MKYQGLHIISITMSSSRRITRSEKRKMKSFFETICHYFQIRFFLVHSKFCFVFLRMAQPWDWQQYLEETARKTYHIIWAICWLNVWSLLNFGFCKVKRKKLGAHHYHIISDLNNKLIRKIFAMLRVSLVSIAKWFSGTQTLMYIIIIIIMMIQLMLGNRVWNTRLLTTLPLVRFGLFSGVQRKMVAECMKNRCTLVYTLCPLIKFHSKLPNFRHFQKFHRLIFPFRLLSCGKMSKWPAFYQNSFAPFPKYKKCHRFN